MDLHDYNIILYGRIVEYFPEDQTATIKISVNRNFDTSAVQSEQVFIEDLKNVPVHTPFGGGWSVTFPIKQGDTCMLCFSQVGYDHWFFEDKDEAGTFAGDPMYWTERMFSLQDGFAMVGFNTIARAIENYSAIHSQWRNAEADQIISLNEDKSITITSPVSVTINAPDVVVNADNVEVNAIEVATVNTKTANISASTKVAIDSPSVTMSGTLDVSGNISAPDVIVSGKAVDGHTHLGNHGTPTGPF